MESCDLCNVSYTPKQLSVCIACEANVCEDCAFVCGNIVCEYDSVVCKKCEHVYKNDWYGDEWCDEKFCDKDCYFSSLRDSWIARDFFDWWMESNWHNKQLKKEIQQLEEKLRALREANSEANSEASTDANSGASSEHRRGKYYDV